MKRTRTVVVVLAVALLAPPVLAQQPTPPPGEAPPPPPPPPAATPAGETPVPTQPGAPPAGGRRKLRMGGEEEGTVEKEGEPEARWGIGAYSRFITTPTFMINLFVEHSTPMRSVAFAGQVIRRKGNLDMAISLEFEKVSPETGLWEEKGENPGEAPLESNGPDLSVFDLSLISADISFIWHTDLTDFMQLRYGPGIGIGVPLGHWTQQDYVCDSTTSLDDLDDPNTSKCMPKAGGIKESKDPPPVVPIVSLLVGLRFKVVEELNLNIEAGWRFPAFFIGGGVGYFF